MTKKKYWICIKPSTFPGEKYNVFCYSVKRKLEGVKDVWQLKDAIIALRDKYVEARYLARIEDELKRIRQATEAKSAESENSLKSLYK